MRRFYVLCSLLAGCGSATPAHPGQATGSIVLDGASAQLAGEIMTTGLTQKSASGHSWLIVSLTLENHGEAALPLLAPLFSVSVSGGLDYAGDSGMTALLTSGCDQSASVSAGNGRVSCSVAFSVESDAPSVLAYRAPDGSLTTAMLPASGRCVSGAMAGDGTCENGAGERCGQTDATGPNAAGCADGLACAPASVLSDTLAYCIYDCAHQNCPSQTMCEKYGGSSSYCFYDSLLDNGTFAQAGERCTPGQLDCGPGLLCDGTCKPQCDRAGASCTNGACTAIGSGNQIVGYVCK
jgi:hypothetical protein